MIFTNEQQIHAATYSTYARDVVPQVTDDVTEFDLFQFENDARNELERLGTANAKLIESMGALSGIASMLQYKMEHHPEKINESKHIEFSKDLKTLIQKVEDLEANYFHHM